MSVIRRVLDWFHLASYPERPKVDRRMMCGINAHIAGAEDLARVKAMGFDLVRLDAPAPVAAATTGEFTTVTVSSYSTDDLTAMFTAAKAAGLKVAVSSVVGWEPSEFFRRFGGIVDLVSPANEPDQAKWRPGDGSIAALAEWFGRCADARLALAPSVRLVIPTASGLSRREPQRYGSDEMIRALPKLGVHALMRPDDLIGHHVYERTPDAVEREFLRARKVYRDAGWNDRGFLISETGWKCPPGGDERRHARYTVNALAQLSRHPEVAGACIYTLKDDVGASPPEHKGILRGDGTPKAAARSLAAALGGEAR